MSYAQQNIANLTDATFLGSPRIGSKVSNFSLRNQPHGFAPEQVEYAEVKEFLNQAFDSIVASSDADLSLIERSNQFDYWHSCLERLSEVSNLISGEHRIILGSLLSCSKGKDWCSFTKETISILIKSTNVLRQPRVTPRESRDTVNSLIKISGRLSYNLDHSVSKEESESELEEMMTSLIMKSKSAKND